MSRPYQVLSILALVSQLIHPCLYFGIQELDLPTWPPSRWHFDIEEADFSSTRRTPPASLIQLVVKPRNHIYLIDISGL